MPDPNPRKTTTRSARNRTKKRQPPLVLVRTRDRSKMLTSRQLQVLVLMCGGLSPKEVATQLELNYSTIRMHLRNSLRRTKARTRDQLMAMAGASGLYHEAIVDDEDAEE